MGSTPASQRAAAEVGSGLHLGVTVGRRLHYLATRADSEILLQKASRSSVDAMMFDLEDGVPEAGKANAREVLRGALKSLDWGTKFKMVRINEISTPEGEADFSLVEARPDALLLPKVRSAADIRRADALIEKEEQAAGAPIGSTRIYAMIETAQAVLEAYDILTASPRMNGALFGHVDFTVDVGCDGISGDSFRLYPGILDIAHALVVMSAAAAKVHAVGPTLASMKDHDSQVKQMRRLFSLGYTGVLVLSPSHIALVEQAYRPDPTEQQFAEGVVNAYDAGLAQQNTSVSTYQDWVVEKPFVAMAQRILGRNA